jgi:hypothetical protein
MTPSLQQRSLALASLLLLALTSLVFYPGLSGGFLFDDFPNIVTNTKLQITDLSWDSLRSAAQAYAPGLYGRPLATLGFAFDFMLGGKDAFGYKLHSLAVHLANTFLVFLLCRKLLSLPRAGGAWPTWVPWAVALAWAIHPMQVSTVLYIVQRMETLSLAFVLGALLAYLKGRCLQAEGRRGWPWLVGSALLAAIGMLAKESAALFPAYALVLELTLLRFDAAKPSTARFLRRAYALGIAGALAVFLVWILPASLAPGAFAGRDFTLEERLLSQMRVLPMYLGQILLPLPDALHFYYDDFAKSTGWLSPPSTLAGGLLLVAMVVAAWRLRTRMPLFSLGIGWFFAAHLITSNVLNLELVFEHRNYFALLGVVLAVLGLVGQIRGAPLARGAKLAAATVLVGLALLGALRAATWGHPLLLATDLVARAPLSPRASSDLATLYIGLAGDDPDSRYYALGQREFERGSLLPGSSPLPEQGLILMAATLGKPVDDAWWARLIEKVRTRPISPQELMAVTGLLQQRYEGVPLDDARLTEAFVALVERDGISPAVPLSFARFASVELGDQALANQMHARAMASPYMTSEYAQRIIDSLAADGRTGEARFAEQEARKRGLVP